MNYDHLLRSILFWKASLNFPDNFKVVRKFHNYIFMQTTIEITIDSATSYVC